MIEAIKAFAGDVALLLGFGAFVYGLWLAWHPLAFIVGGLVLAIAAYIYGYGVERFGGRAK